MKTILAVILVLIFATLSFAGEGSVLKVDDNNRVIQGVLTPSTVQKITTSGTSAPTTNAFVYGIVRVACSEATFITFAASPTATTSSSFLPANAIEYFAGNVGLKGAGIQSTTGGFCTFSEMK